jgi:single-strand DNA-binding protein
MVNCVILVGRLGQDPKLTVTSSGISLCKFSIAVDRRFKNQQGERETDWIDVVAWRERAEFCANYLKKGSTVAVQGALQVRKWETPEGEPRRFWEVVADSVTSVARSAREDDSHAVPGDEHAPPPPAGTTAPASPGSAKKKLDESFGDSADDAFDPTGDDPFGGE